MSSTKQLTHTKFKKLYANSVQSKRTELSDKRRMDALRETSSIVEDMNINKEFDLNYYDFED